MAEIKAYDLRNGVTIVGTSSGKGIVEDYLVFNTNEVIKESIEEKEDYASILRKKYDNNHVRSQKVNLLEIIAIHEL